MGKRLLYRKLRNTRGVPEEGPREHIRNALASIVAERDLIAMGQEPSNPAELSEWLQHVQQRLEKALELMGDRLVNNPYSRGPKRRIVRRKNPALMVLGANPRVVDATIATWAKIEYRRPDDPDGKNIIRVHEFKDGFEIGWLTDGSVQLSHPSHPLWMDDKE
jgi:hypothetical protein